MRWNEIKAGELNGAAQRLWTAFGEDADLIVKRINTESGFVDHLACFAKKLKFEPSTSQVRARKIMGANMFGIEEAMKYFRVVPSVNQFLALSEVPFSEKTLKACKYTHILVAVFPISIRDMHCKLELNRYFYDLGGVEDRSLNYRGEVGWHLVQKTPVEGSGAQCWDVQQALLGAHDQTPRMQKMVYTIIGHHKATGERLFQRVYVRCQDFDSNGNHTRVGCFDHQGIRTYSERSDQHCGVCLASERKPSSAPRCVRKTRIIEFLKARVL